MNREMKGAVIGGIVLIAIGIIALIGQVMPDSWSWLIGAGALLLPGLGFILAGIVSRQFGWFVPGGILTGLGAGVAAISGPWSDGFTVDDGGIFLMAFAAGWFLITLLSALFTRDTQWWPVIPGGIIGLVGLAVAYGGNFMRALEWLNYVWPVALIVGGLAILWRGFRPKEEESIEKPVEKQA